MKRSIMLVNCYNDTIPSADTACAIIWLRKLDSIIPDVELQSAYEGRVLQLIIAVVCMNREWCISTTIQI
uniref:Uncharacterized protein n=1 Tax=Megaselia scalaris TaxID=36166 RepID=T1GFS8_MEGSC